MANDPKLSYDATDAMLGALADALNSGILRIYQSSGTPPTNADDAINGTLLAALSCAATFETSVTNGVLTAGTISDDTSADNTGTADYFRLWDSAGTTCYFQGTVGTSGCDLNLNSVSIQSGANVSVTSLTITLPRE